MIYLNCDNLNTKIVIPSPVVKSAVDNFILVGADGSMMTTECQDISTTALTYELTPTSGSGFDFSGAQPGEYTMTLRFGRSKVAEMLVSLRTTSDIDIYYDEEKEVTRIPDQFISYDSITGKPVFRTINGQRIDDGPGNIVIDGSGATINIDDALSTESLNPVENRVITKKIQQVESSIPKDALKKSDIATINGQSITEGGDVTIESGVSNWDEITNKPDFKPVATSGDYQDLTNKPTIPTDNAELTNGADYATNTRVNEVEDKIPTDTVTSAQLNAVKKTAESKTTMQEVEAKDYATNTRVNEVEDKIPTDTVTSAQLNAVKKTAESKTTMQEVEAKDYATNTRVNEVEDQIQPLPTFKTINGQTITDGPGDIEIVGDITSAEVDQRIATAVTPRNIKAVDQVELATVEIPTAGVTEERVNQLIDANTNGFQTAQDVESTITSKDYATNTRVNEVDEKFASYTPTANIKTINGQSITDGPGDITIEGGSTLEAPFEEVLATYSGTDITFFPIGGDPTRDLYIQNNHRYVVTYPDVSQGTEMGWDFPHMDRYEILFKIPEEYNGAESIARWTENRYGAFKYKKGFWYLASCNNQTVIIYQLDSDSITEERVEQIVTSKDYQTYNQVEEIVTSKDYQTSSQVDQIVTSKDYQTYNQVEEIVTSKDYQTSSQVDQIVTSKDYQTYNQVDQIVTSKDYQTYNQVEEIANNKVNGQPSETWEFELEDGSTIQKNIVVK